MAGKGLDRASVIAAALRVADAKGLAAVSMRAVGKELGVEAMSLYHHVPNKDSLLDGMVDWVFSRWTPPRLDEPWREATQRRAAEARAVLGQHPWALTVLDSRRAPGGATLEHHEAVLANLRSQGFSVELASHAFAAVDSYVFGFVLTETALPFEEPEGAEDMIAELDLGSYPHLMELAQARVLGHEYRFGDEFDFGLGLILDRLEQLLARPALT